MTGGVVRTAELRIMANASATITDDVAAAVIDAGDVLVEGTLQMNHGQVQADNLAVAPGSSGGGGGRVEIGLGGATGGGQFGNFILDGSAVLAGTLQLYLIDGFTPTLGDDFALISALSILGAFESVEGLALTENIGLTLDYSSTALLLLARWLGDASGDNFVGSDDLSIILARWNQQATAGVWLEGDLDGDGFVGSNDLSIVLNHWNQDQSPDVAGLLAPEPGAAGMLLMLGAGLVLRRWRPVV